MDTKSEFMNWRAGPVYRDMIEKIREKKPDLRSNSEVIRYAVCNLAKQVGIEA